MRTGRIVHQEFGERCGQCGAFLSACSCTVASPSPQSQTALVRTERKRGHLVTTVQGLAHTQPEFKALCQQLKAHCGTGGTFKDSVIEIQGDQLLKIKPYLQKLGYRVR